MTIKELHNITDKENRILIGWDGSTKELNRNSILELSAYGNYSIEYIAAVSANIIEASIKAIPATE